MNPWILIYEKTLNWQKIRKQTASHKSKKAIKKKKTSHLYKSDNEIKRLSKISAKRQVKDDIANNMFNRRFGDLNEVERKKINAKVKENIFKQKVKKVTQTKFIERKQKQQEKKEKDKLKKQKEAIKRKKHAIESEENRKKEAKKLNIEKKHNKEKIINLKQKSIKTKEKENKEQIEDKRQAEKKVIKKKQKQLDKNREKTEESKLTNWQKEYLLVEQNIVRI